MISALLPSSRVDPFVRDHLPAEQNWPRLCWNEVGHDYPEQLNCAAELLDAQVERGWGERIALRTETSTCTYRELLHRANGIARVLRDKLGLVPGNRVLLRGYNHPMLVACWLGVLKAGGVVITSMPLLRSRELVQMLDKAHVDFALCDKRLHEPLEQACAIAQKLPPTLYFNDDATNFQAASNSQESLRSLDTWLAEMSEAELSSFENARTQSDDPALIAFTSGTTGLPKACVHVHRDVLAICDAFPPDILSPRASDIFCTTSPLAFTYGLGAAVCFPLRYGASSLLMESSTPAGILRAIERHHVTILLSVPTFWRQMTPLAHDYSLARLRCCVSAGEPLPEATRRHWHEATNLEIIDGLGTTELLHIVIAHPPDRVRKGAVGTAVRGYEICILDDAGQPLPPGTLGRLAVRGPTGCRYLDDARQRDYVVDGWNLTGDVGMMDEAGYFYYHARHDDLIVTSGYNVTGQEVEDVLLHHPAVLECAVIGVPDEARGQLIKAFVVPKPGIQADSSLTKALQDFVKQQVAPYKYPRLIEFLEALPRTESSKLQRYKLRMKPQTEVSSVMGERENTNANINKNATALSILQPKGWPSPRGYANGVVATGQMIFVAGQVGWDEQHVFRSTDLVEQIRQALQNVITVLAAGGARPEHVVRLNWYLADKNEYRKRRKEIGAVYRELMGTHYPAMTAVQVCDFIEDGACVEIEATALFPG